jgi:membrane-associated phospholipid phosphatase
MDQFTDHSKNNPLFWQPKFDLLDCLLQRKAGHVKLIFLNYLIWFFLLFVCYLLINRHPDLLFPILVSIVISEIVEKYGKQHALWRRPFFKKHQHTPPGLVESWYKTGSFPSGHTIKAAYFFFLIAQVQVISPVVYLLVTIPLILFRVLVGFHYPIDVVGGLAIGWLIWLFSSLFPSPEIVTNLIEIILSFVFPQ